MAAMNTDSRKLYVEVVSWPDTKGRIVYHGIKMNQKIYAIEKVLGIKKAASQIAGGVGFCYEILLAGLPKAPKYLWYDEIEQRWFAIPAFFVFSLACLFDL